MSRRVVPVLLALGLVSAACGGGPVATPTGEPTSPDATGSPTTGDGTSPTQNPSPDSPNLEAVRVRLVQVATLELPIAMAVRGGDDALYVAEKTGRVRAVRGGEVDRNPVVDLRGEVSLGSEQGLLGLAFSPDGRFLYLNYTDLSGHTRVVEFAMDGGRVDPGSRRQVLFVNQPFANHNGGNLAFGPDGYLYIGLGDGGSGGDPQGYAQNLSTVLGKMLRIEPRPGRRSPYRIPPDNPFVGRDGARMEIWAFGLRNPWRYTFDRATGDLWIGDVGQSSREEVNFQRGGSRGGENYGWDRMEGTLNVEGEPPRDSVPPVFEYATGEDGRAVVAGYVYRGSRIPELVGAFLFTDFYNSRIVALVREGDRIVERRVIHDGVGLTASFGQDLDGELYVLSFEGGVYRIEPR